VGGGGGGGGVTGRIKLYYQKLPIPKILISQH
jgi:hypothetical protein